MTTAPDPDTEFVRERALAAMDPDDLATDGGGRRIDPEAFYVIEEGGEGPTAVVAADIAEQDAALDAADRSRNQVVVWGHALRDIRAREAAPLRWRTDADEPDLVTDGGLPHACACGARYRRRDLAAICCLVDALGGGRR